MCDALDGRLGSGSGREEFGFNIKERIDDGMYDALDDRLGDGSGRESSDLMDKSKSMMECMMHLMTDLGMAPGGRVRICWTRVNR